MWYKKPMYCFFVVSIPEMRILSILLIKSDLKWCIHLRRSLYLAYDLHILLTFIFYCDKTFLLLPQYLTLCSWPSYFSDTTRFWCYHTIWQCVFDIYIILWQHVSVLPQYLTFFYWPTYFTLTRTFCRSPQYLTLCSWPSYFTGTIPFCCYHNIWHCVLGLHYVLWQDLFVATMLFDVFFTFIFYCDNTFLLLPRYLRLWSWHS